MNRTTVAVDLAKSVFQLAVADASWKVVETHRLARAQFERWLHNRDVGLVTMESCGRSSPCSRHAPGARQVGRAAGPAGPAPHPQPVDGHAHLAHQCPERLPGEFGIAMPVGARIGLETFSRVLADPGTAVPALIRGVMALLVDGVRLLGKRGPKALWRDRAGMSRIA